MEDNQKKLYENFKKEAQENKDPIIRERCKKAAEEILKSFPKFEVKDKKTDSKEVKEKK